MRQKPLSDRHRRLADLVHDQAEAVPVLYLPDSFTDGAELLRICTKFRLEGIVSKRLDRPYVSGPTRDWLKTKCAAWKEANRWRAEAFAK
jgi:bifunctional non-homologous end joining protein LigD